MTIANEAFAAVCGERDQALQAVAELHDWLSVSRNWLNACRDNFGDYHDWPVNNDDLDYIQNILNEHPHLIL